MDGVCELTRPLKKEEKMKTRSSSRHLILFEDFEAEAEHHENWSESNESSREFPHEIKSEAFWRKAVAHDRFASSVLETVLKKQRGFASDRQMQILERARRGDRTPYSPRN
jgi:hypothetical protein